MSLRKNKEFIYVQKNDMPKYGLVLLNTHFLNFKRIVNLIFTGPCIIVIFEE